MNREGRNENNEVIPGCGHAWKDSVLLQALKGEHFVSSGFSREGTLILQALSLNREHCVSWDTRFQARSKDQEILEEGGGAGPSS